MYTSNMAAVTIARRMTTAPHTREFSIKLGAIKIAVLSLRANSYSTDTMSAEDWRDKPDQSHIYAGINVIKKTSRNKCNFSDRQKSAMTDETKEKR